MSRATDVVCGMPVDREAAQARELFATHTGRDYFFCSRECLHAFQQNPGQYGEGVAGPAAPDGKTNDRYAG